MRDYLCLLGLLGLVVWAGLSVRQARMVAYEQIFGPGG